MKAVAVGLALLAAAGCGAGHSAVSPAGGLPAKLATSEVPWNAGNADVGRVVAVAELGDSVVVVGDAATIFVGGSFVANDRSAPGWTWAGTISAPDGSGTWLIATTSDGQLRRLRSRASLERVSDRFGLSSDRVRGACSAGPHDTVFLLEDGLARSDGGHVHRVDGQFTSIACAPGVIAATTPSGIRLLGPAGGDRLLSVPSPLVAFTPSGRLIATSGSHLFAASGTGELTRVHIAHAPITGLAATAGGAWFSTTEGLGYFDGASVTEAKEPRLTGGSTLAASTTGDVWAVVNGGLLRFARGDAPSPATAWSANVAPLFQRTCSRCHGPGGSSGLDLSSAAAWTASRGEIQARVLENRTMPPAGVPFTDADRETVRRFLTGH